MAQSVGDRLAQCRRVLSVVLGRDVRQDEMAEITNFSPAVWSHWETGRRRPSRDTVTQIVERLKALGLDWLTESWIDYGEGGGPPKLGTAPVKPIRDKKPSPKVNSGHKTKPVRKIGNGKGKH